MQLRLSARVLAAAGALALATTLSSCGFDYATDRVYTPAAGTNDRTALIDVLGATIVSSQEGSGTFIAGFANNSTDQDLSVESLTVETMPDDDDAAQSLDVVEFEPIEIAPQGFVTLADGGGIVVSGAITAGDFVNVTVGFDDGSSTTFEVPVMPNCNEWTGLDESAEDEAAAEQDDQCTAEESGVEH